MTLPGLEPLVDTSQLADAGNLAALKQAAARNSPQALQAAAKQFESLFVSMVLKSMQKANFKDPLFGSGQGNLYQQMYDDQVAAEISKGKGLGLADMLVQQLRQEQPAAGSGQGVTPGATSGGATGAGPSAAGPVPAAATSTAGPTAQSACPTRAEQAAFARSLWPDAQQAARQLGVSPVALLSQAALETDWGRRMPRNAGGGSSNNLFGIKATSWSGPAAASTTQEFSGDVATTVEAQFRAYGSPGQCFQDYVSVLKSNPRYAAAIGTGSDINAFGSALQQGGYATDPDYAGKLTAVAGTLVQALASQPPGSLGAALPPAASGPLKFAAALPTTSGSGTLQR
jgi:flagellar protein FlgJ